MKTQATLLAACLLGAGLATAQTNTNSSSTPATTTNSTSGTTTPTTTTTDMNSTSPTMTNGTGSTTGTGTMNSTGTTTNGTGVGVTGSTTTNSATSPAYGGTTTTSTTETDNTTGRTMRDKSAKNYKNFVFGVYAGLNTTKFKGEAVDTQGDVSGRLGYQLGFLCGAVVACMASLGLSILRRVQTIFTAGSGQTAASIQDQINIKYIQVPVYIGYKLVESDRGISAVRLQAGLEYANQIGSDANQFGNVQNFKVKSGTFNGLGQLGFDIGPLLIDLTYHYGFSDAVSGTGFNGSQRRILSASVGFKF